MLLPPSIIVAALLCLGVVVSRMRCVSLDQHKEIVGEACMWRVCVGRRAALCKSSCRAYARTLSTVVCSIGATACTAWLGSPPVLEARAMRLFGHPLNAAAHTMRGQAWASKFNSAVAQATRSAMHRVC